MGEKSSEPQAEHLPPCQYLSPLYHAEGSWQTETEFPIQKSRSFQKSLGKGESKAEEQGEEEGGE